MTKTKEQVVAEAKALATTAEKVALVNQFVAEALVEDDSLDEQALTNELMELITAVNGGIGGDNGELSLDDLLEEFMSEELHKTTDDHQKIVDALVNNPKCRRVKGLTCTNVNVEFYPNYISVRVTVDGEVKTSPADEHSNKPVTSNCVFTTAIALFAVCKRNPKLSAIAYGLNSNLKEVVEKTARKVLLGAKLDVIMQFVMPHEEYRNPFSKDADPVTWNNVHVMHHLIDITPGEMQDEAYREFVKA